MRNTIASIELAGRTYTLKQPESWALMQAARVLERVKSQPGTELRSVPDWWRWIVTAGIDAHDQPWIDLPAADGFRLLTSILVAWRNDGQFDEVPKARMYGQLARQVSMIAHWLLVAELPDSPRDPEAARRAFEAELHGESGVVAVLPTAPPAFEYDWPGCTWVRWNGWQFTFTARQGDFLHALIVSRRWRAPHMAIADLEVAVRDRERERECERDASAPGCRPTPARTVFHRHPAWGRLIVKPTRHTIALHPDIVIDR